MTENEVQINRFLPFVVEQLSFNKNTTLKNKTLENLRPERANQYTIQEMGLYQFKYHKQHNNHSW